MLQNRYLFAIFLPILLLFFVNFTNKNRCETYLSYFLINFSSRCSYDPNVDLDSPRIIEKYTQSLREYEIITKDGYILSMFRIVQENPVGVVLLQPPITAGSIAWLSDGNNSLALALWRQGYDIWLGNHRGYSHSRRHLSLKITNPKFWDYGVHELAMHDLKAQLELIYKTTNGSKIIFVGYSLSTKTLAIYSSLHPKESSKFIKSSILIGPVTIMNHISSFYKWVFYLIKLLKTYFRSGELWSFEILRPVLQATTFVPVVANFISKITVGWSANGMDPMLFPYIFAHHGRGISYKMLYHIEQMISNDDGYPMYDYGSSENLAIYNATEAPDYPLHQILLPMYFLRGSNDVLATHKDLAAFCDKIADKSLIKGYATIPDFNHIDYLLNKRRNKTYELIFKILNEIKEN